MYISLPVADSDTAAPSSAEELLQPYLDATLTLTSSTSPESSPSTSNSPLKPLFKLFYLQHPTSPLSTPPSEVNTSSQGDLHSYIVPAPIPSFPLPECPDAAATQAEAVFWEAAKVLRVRDPTRSDSAVSAEEEVEEIDSFWPPLGAQNHEDDQDDGEW